jgi:BMFP domain-containing protein YqiC
MQTQTRFFDDVARLASGAIGGLAAIRQEIESRVRDQVERMLRNMDLVTREEFEVVRAMASRARAEQEDLAARLAALEAEIRREKPTVGAEEPPAAPGGPAAGPP